MSLTIRHLDQRIEADPRRVLLRPFDMSGPEQRRNVLSRVLAIPEAQVPELLELVLNKFGRRHSAVHQLMVGRFEEVRYLLPSDQELSPARMALAGAYFLSEFSLESAALFNPSMVPHPDQSALAASSVRFILSLRATGEGHVSSTCFRTGVLAADGSIRLDPAGRLAREPVKSPNPLFESELFGRKLFELGLDNPFAQRVCERLGEFFNLDDLRDTMGRERWRGRNLGAADQPDSDIEATILALAISNYEVEFAPEIPLSARVIFPSTPSQQNGIEDARFVRFVEQDESFRYYATYTAYDGRLILPQLMETEDFQSFRFITLNGPAVRNKGMALFPRKVGGRYAMLSRQDNENVRLMYSDNIHFWYESRVLVRPRFPWELVQIGNCGSPLETDAGWLVLSHGVGPMREYTIGAYLLDLEQPQRLIGRLRNPILVPIDGERDGYVPNVVYSCGGMVHGDLLALPYGVADQSIRFVTLDLRALLGAFE